MLLIHTHVSCLSGVPQAHLFQRDCSTTCVNTSNCVRVKVLSSSHCSQKTAPLSSQTPKYSGHLFMIISCLSACVLLAGHKHKCLMIVYSGMLPALNQITVIQTGVSQRRWRTKVVAWKIRRGVHKSHKKSLFNCCAPKYKTIDCL
jgi:hypothetical protein